jgi:hypothetical protein
VTLDETLGNWSHFLKPVHRIKNSLTVKQLLNSVSYFIVINFLSGLKNAFCRAWGTGDEFMEPKEECHGPKEFGIQNWMLESPISDKIFSRVSNNFLFSISLEGSGTRMRRNSSRMRTILLTCWI